MNNNGTNIFVYPTSITNWLGNEVSMENIAREIFSSEDSLKRFVEAISDVQADAIYQLLNARGCSINHGNARNGLANWRKTLR